jgi:putative peptide zinc metalloprotease protein
MSRSLFSSSWHSVATLYPRLVPQVQMHRHSYRGQIWFVLQNPSSGRYHRLSAAAQRLVSRMDGQRTVQALWEEANSHGDDDACTQNEIVDLLVQLHSADLLQTDITPDSAALLVRYKKKRGETFKQWLMNPTSLKLPLVNPAPLIERYLPAVSWCFSGWGLALWLAVVIPALILAIQHWSALTHNFSDQVLSSSNLLVMALVFPVVKLLHELGHAFATRTWGGHVHEMGLMFLVFAPFPYVDTSASAAFPSKYQRALVGAAGMLVEVFIAALALFVWELSEPGIVRAIAYNTMVIAGISTLVVNGNPLLRYDAYYILTDLIEIPNLAQRGQQYLTWLWDRYFYGVHDLTPPMTAAGEKPWLILYTPLAWCYRTFVTLSIMLFVAGEFFIIGVLLALWSLTTQFGLPLWKAWKHIYRGASLQQRREVARHRTHALMAAMLALIFVLPIPLRTTAEGVIWLPDQAMLHAGGDGFFQRWLVAPNTYVHKGMALYVLEDAALAAEVAVSRAKVAEAEARYRAEQFGEPAKAALTLRRLTQEQEALTRLQERAARLVGYAESEGILVVATAQDMNTRFFKQGALVGYILDAEQLKVRAVVSQDDIDLVRSRLKNIDIRLSENVMFQHPATAIRELPSGVNDLPSSALALSGGGTIATNPNDNNGTKTLERVFLLDLKPTSLKLPATFGERAYVRFQHGYEPLGFQGLRRLRQLFLSHFHV